MACAPSSRTSAPDCSPVQIRNADGNYIIPGAWGDIPYRTVAGVDLAMDAFIQPGSDARPGVIVVHGGGWTSGSRIAFVGQFLELLTDAGFNWFSVDYRLGPEHPHPAALEDLRSAVDFIRCNAVRFQIDPDRLALLGEDSGAHLAALLAAEKPAGVRALAALGGFFDLASLQQVREDAELRRYFGVEEGDPDQALRRLSPTRTAKSVPAALVVHGGADAESPVQQARDFCQALRNGGGRCQLLEVEGAIHRPENWTPSQWGYKQRLVEWLSEELDLGPRETESHSHPKLRKNIVYSRIRQPDGGELELKMDAFVPEGAGPFPGLILIHGGGWEAGDKVTYLTPLLEPLSKAGFAWFSIDYRLTPQYRHPDQLEDLRRAIRFVRHRAAEFRVEPREIALIGESASGQMALQVAAQPCPGLSEAVDSVDRELCDVQAVVSFYGVYDFLPLIEGAKSNSLLVRLFGLQKLDQPARRVLRAYSPIHQVHADMPQALLIHGTDEFLWEQGVRLQERLAQLGVDHRLLALEGAPHGMENWEGHAEWETYKGLLVEWLNRRLKR